jgi:hypothetical protein
MWYFDAWAVMDGLAFVSDRAKDQIGSTSTVFLSVPDLEPVPVGRISTALRATRAGFQDGFRDGEREEIGFETLEQVREAIRRGYLGGELTEGTTAPLAPVEPSPEGGEPNAEPLAGPPIDGGEFYERRLTELGHTTNSWRDYSALCYEDSRNALLETLNGGAGVLDLYPYLRAFGEATLVEYAYRNRPTLQRGEQVGLLVRWATLLYTLGLWEHYGEFSGFLAAEGFDGRLRDVLEESVYYLSRSWAQWPESALPATAQSLLFQIPCPLRGHWHRGIGRLGDKLLLPLVDRQYFAANPELPEFIPLLLCSMAIVTDQPVIHWRLSGGRDADRRRLIALAFRWISRELPGAELPAEAESLLSDYAWKRLERQEALSEDPEGSEGTPEAELPPEEEGPRSEDAWEGLRGRIPGFMDYRPYKHDDETRAWRRREEGSAEI